MAKYLLGIDNGGTMIKAAIFDLDGKEIAVASQNTPVIMPKEGYQERDVNDLWEINSETIRAVINKSGIRSEDILGVGCTGHGKGLYLWGMDGKPCCNAIASTDHRAQSYVRMWKDNGIAKKAYEKTLQYPIACQPVPLLAWMKDNQPEVYANIKWIFEAKDFTRFMLTGEAYAERTDYSGTCLMNLLTGKYEKELLELFGIPEMFDKLPPLKNSFDHCGNVTKEAAAKTGLSEGTPVCGGMFDIDACAVAMDVTVEEKLCVITGTWSINEYISKTPVYTSKTTLNSFFCIPGYYLIEESSPTSAGNLEWFIRNGMFSETVGGSVYKQIDDLVAGTLPEESKLVFIPFLYGSNEENLDSACFFGMNNGHEKKHLLRAVFEGVVFSHMTHIERLLTTRENPSAIRLAGGAAHSAVWVQMFADVTGIPVEVVETRELGTLGCAMAAGITAGIYRDYKEAAAKMVKIANCVLPDMKNHAVYQDKYLRYKKLVAALAGMEKMK